MQHGKAYVAMDAQSPALSHGLAVGGQQSCIGSDADMVGSCGCSLNAAPAAGSIATDAAMRRANMVRKTAMSPPNIRWWQRHRQVTISRGTFAGKLLPGA
jgi:hypothetical protein